MDATWSWRPVQGCNPSDGGDWRAQHDPESRSMISTMDANWRPVQGCNNLPAGVDLNAPAIAGGDWRAKIKPEARSRIVSKILEVMKEHLPVSEPEGLNELQRRAVGYERRFYTIAVNKSHYLRLITMKMISMEKHAHLNAPGLPNQNNPGEVIEPGAVIVMDYLDDHVDGTNSRLQVLVQKRLEVLNKRAKGGCSCMMFMLISVVATLILVVIKYL